MIVNVLSAKVKLNDKIPNGNPFSYQINRYFIELFLDLRRYVTQPKLLSRSSVRIRSEM